MIYILEDIYVDALLNDLLTALISHTAHMLKYT